MKSYKKYYILLTILVVLLFAANVFFGAINIPFSSVLDVILGRSEQMSTESIIILNSRIPQTITALFAGVALAISGLMLQTLFSNALASPSIMGISSGASMGVAIVTLFLGGNIASFGIGGQLAIMAASLIGALLVLFAILFFSLKVRNTVMLLIIGIMVGYVASSVVSLLTYLSTTEGVYTFVMWGMGDFSSVSSSNLGYFTCSILVAIIIAFLTVKPLNGLLLGESYCENLGINIKKARITILFSTGILTAVVTAFCGPISFIGLVAPHIARLLIGSSDHRALLPTTALIGGITTLLCNLLSTTAGGGLIIPLNVITPCLGAPIIIYVIVNRDKIPYFSN
ncbi:MAG: iron ABC transporter permease [Rikenellaceae bacterium]